MGIAPEAHSGIVISHLYMMHLKFDLDSLVLPNVDSLAMGALAVPAALWQHDGQVMRWRKLERATHIACLVPPDA